MNIYEVPAVIEDELPAVKAELRQDCPAGNIHAAIQVLVKYTRNMIRLHNLPAVSKCMLLADKLYTRGNNLVKNAVENVYVYAFSGMRSSCEGKEWQLIQAKMPVSLYSIYVRQIYRSGI